MLNSFGPLYKYVLSLRRYRHSLIFCRSISASPHRQRYLAGNPMPDTPPPSARSQSTSQSHSTASSHSPTPLILNGNSNSRRNGMLSPTSPTSTVSSTIVGARTNGSHTSGPPTPTQLTQPTLSSRPSSTSVHNSISTSSSSASLMHNTQPPPHPSGNNGHPTRLRSKDLFYPSASTTLSTPSGPSGSGTTLTYHLITRHLALLALIPTAVYEERRGLVEYNVVFFREGVQEICDVEEEVRGAG